MEITFTSGLSEAAAELLKQKEEKEVSNPLSPVLEIIRRVILIFRKEKIKRSGKLSSRPKKRKERKRKSRKEASSKVKLQI